MDEQVKKIREEPGEEETKSSIWRLQGIFFEPSATFEDINKKPTFLVPLLLSILIALIGWNLVDNLVDLQEVMEVQIKASPQAERLTQEQIELQAKHPEQHEGQPVADPTRERTHRNLSGLPEV